jgi:hypothetical protein
MTKKYTSEQFWKLYDKLPQELKDALFAEETGENIYDICKRNEISENLDSIVEYVGQVLVGVLPPGDFKETLEKELKLEERIAKKIAQELNRFIFYPVRNSLEKLYKIEITTLAKSKTTPSIEEKHPIPLTEDTYREPIK